MICEACGLPIRMERRAHNLFDIEHHHICQRCVRKYPVVPLTEVIPIEGGEIRLTTLIQGRRRAHPTAHMSFMGPMVHMVSKIFPRDIVLWFDIVHDEDIRLLDAMSLGDIHALTVYHTINDKGEKP